MKTLILYATKHGATGEIARRIADKISGATLHDLSHSGVPPVAEFDCVIIGSSIYAGMIRKQAKTFIAQNSDTLRSKKLGVFLSGMDTKKENEFFTENFSSDMLKNAKSTAMLGGIFDPKKVAFAERLIMKAVAKQSEYTNTIDDEKIEKFVTDVTSK